jgi:hypothetical protein
MKRECAECLIEKAERQFSPGMDVCKGCETRMHREAEQYAVKAAQRDANARTTEHKEWAKGVEPTRTADRDKAPPREYPWPWRREK